MFGIPEERVSISSPCQVTCAPLNASIGYRLTNNSENADPSQDFCTASRFDDPTINNCAFCYSLIDEQLFTANCALHPHPLCPNTDKTSSPPSPPHPLPRPSHKRRPLLPRRTHHLQRNPDSRPRRPRRRLRRRTRSTRHGPGGRNRPPPRRRRPHHRLRLLGLFPLHPSQETTYGFLWSDESCA
jgi:hypothetical protein